MAESQPTTAVFAMFGEARAYEIAVALLRAEAPDEIRAALTAMEEHLIEMGRPGPDERWAETLAVVQSLRQAWEDPLRDLSLLND